MTNRLRQNPHRPEPNIFFLDEESEGIHPISSDMLNEKIIALTLVGYSYWRAWREPTEN